ncbi:MAG: ATP synthase F1 subunit gamma [Ruminiclostridium sp.]|nr:ATP synthase F1 subunit gamma [Ruminiclostridium sp.]MBQ8411975.1 ATP synthase F1 subunit gamma [Ruminiclostridium sp.]MBQ8842527.1 ATP synthase F1 subunit gamma [Ruminiclostridium sp.]
MATGNMKDIKRRIRSVGSTKQITKAMELVSSSKLRRAKQRAEAARPYFEAQYTLLSEIASVKKDFTTVYTESRPVKRRLFIVIAGDRGLAGGYNSNILKAAVAAHAGDEQNPKIIAVGRKAVEYFEKRDYELIGSYPYLAENVKTAKCADIANIATEMFSSGEVDEVRLFYTAFVSPLVQNPEQIKLLPISDIGTGTGEDMGFITYDPSPEAVFNRIVPKFVMSLLTCGIVESYASEQGARRTAMESATDNADQMIADLSLIYNRARQEKITNEINEIVSGANAL